MGRVCAVTGCRSGSYQDSAQRKAAGLERLTLFGIPQRNNVLATWSFALRQKLSKTDFICEKHFSKDNVIKNDKTVLRDGTINIIPRQKALLEANAIPTLNIEETIDLICEAQDYHNETEPVRDAQEHMEVQVMSKPVNVVLIPIESNNPVLGMQSESPDNIQMDRDPLADEVWEVVDSPLTTTIDQVFDNLKAMELLPERWCWITNRQCEKSIIFIHLDPFTKLPSLRLVLYNNLSVKAHTADGKIDIQLETNVTSVESLRELLDELSKRIICAGTGMEEQKHSELCTGLIPPNEYTNQVMAPRCFFCRKERHSLKKSLNRRKSSPEIRYEQLKKQCKLRQRTIKHLEEKLTLLTLLQQAREDERIKLCEKSLHR